MTKIFRIYPDNPQKRLLVQAAEIFNAGGVVAYPTDSGYALGCSLGDKYALERIRYIRNLNEKHNFTLVCHDLSELATYAKVNNSVFRLLKAMTPGAYTFILEATKEVPNRFLQPKRKTIGLRIPDNAIAMALLEELDAPILSVTLIMPGDAVPLSNAEEIQNVLQDKIELIIDGGFCGVEPTTVVDFVTSGDDSPTLLRIGKGDPALFLEQKKQKTGQGAGSFAFISGSLLK